MTLLHESPLIPEIVATALHRFDAEPCLLLTDGVASYREVRDLVGRLQQEQQAAGLGPGSRVAVLSRNRPEVLVNIMATLLNGCVLTPLHPLGSLDDHRFVLDDADIGCLIYDPDGFEDHAAALHSGRPCLTMLALGPSAVGANYWAAASTRPARPLAAALVGPDDLCAVPYTGGSTGRPKGVMLTHRMWLAMTIIQMTEWDFPTEIRMLVVTPLSHAAMSLLVPVLVRGGSFHVMGGFSAEAFFDAVERHRITCTLIVPSILYALQASDRSPPADMSSMETIFYGASPVSPARLAQAIRAWGRIFYQFYGQTEAPTVISNLNRSDHDPSIPDRLASCGRPAPWIRVELLDDDGEAVPVGEPGEICVRGPLASPGYYRRPDETRELLRGDWLHTGDIGRFDTDGFLYIVDRVKDMVITGGFNVFPREVEDVLTGHAAVDIAAVIGVPDDRFGEAVKAIVRPMPGIDAGNELTEELQQMVRRDKGPVHVPKSIDYVDDIPLTPLGKPDKRALQARYWRSRQRNVG